MHLRASSTGYGLLGQQNFSLVLLWTTVWITCVKRHRACAHIGEMLGSQLLVRPSVGVLTWGNAVRTLCINKELELSTHRAAMTDK